MAEDSFLERLLNSPTVLAIAAVLGFLILLSCGGGLFGLEHYSINRARSLEQGAAQAVTVPADRVDPSNEGKLVHLTGEATTRDSVADPDLGIAAVCIALGREVELYQIKETKKETKKGDKTVVTYTHDRTWSKDSPKRLEQPPAGEKNPSEKPYREATFRAQDVKVGAFRLTASQIAKIPPEEPLTATEAMLAQVPEEIRGRSKVDGEGRLFVSAAGGSTPDAPQVGDVRVRYKVAKPQVVSLAARQVGSSFEPYASEGGSDIDELRPGALSARELFEKAQSSHAVLSWVGRILCYGFLVLGVFLLIYRQSAANTGMAPEGILTHLALGFLACSLALALAFIISGLRWLSYSPGAGAGLLATGTIGAALLIVLTRLLRIGNVFSGAKKRSARELELFRQTAIEPDDPQPRLQLAALLQKNGNPMGEFIRVDNDLELLPPGDPAREPLDTRWGELLNKHGKTWFAPLRRLGLEPTIAGTFFPSLWMHHGIIDEVTVDLPGILPEKAKQLFAAVPGLRILALHNIRMVQGVGGWKDITWKPDLAAIMQLPQLEQIGVLRMSSISLTADDFKAVVSSPYLENLTELDFSYNSIGTQGAALLARAQTLKRLRVLNLRACDLSENGGVVLGKAANLAQLTSLNVGNNKVGKNGAIALASSAFLQNLQELVLDSNEIGPTGAQAVAASPHWRKLTALELGSNEIGPQGAAMLARSPNLAQVKTLKLGSNKIGAALKNLAASPHLAKVEVLELDSNEINDESLIALTASPVIRQLTELSLADNQIGDAGLKALAAWPALARVTKLRLQRNKLTAAGIQALASSPYLHALEELDLGENNVGVAGAQALAGSPVLKSLKYFWIREAQLTSQGELALKKRFGDVVHMT